ncbi:uncharacterized protein SPAPADRAFT_134514 [Spathaspora passalidarum NRRL Y-27907]|uniref:MICOS complex subunit MIC12 n=1 Tax=Spathaspora passalidarum (strain NRRL Y-27907 / 11-Y1) TaxID=619300 RepID=G3AJQ0_SPAPN|nr:uncharacterized protein SPAPADRAFT_134514 [Spathaspora passalidarum NRRL Y-27907]EGW33951.1 hypothetical protein SPAPADRAFT_134514 [Spathaspora passalidarum NRRL Y-27907]
MGGRIHGFLGGVLLTSVFTYYTTEYIHKNQQFISQQLRQSNRITQRIVNQEAIPQDNTPRDSRILTTNRNFKETCKDIWNEEIITAVNWIYSIDWYDLGLNLDKKVLSYINKN